MVIPKFIAVSKLKSNKHIWFTQDGSMENTITTYKLKNHSNWGILLPRIASTCWANASSCDLLMVEGLHVEVVCSLGSCCGSLFESFKNPYIWNMSGPLSVSEATIIPVNSNININCICAMIQYSCWCSRQEMLCSGKQVPPWRE